ncbi:MAG: ATP-binding protein [Bacteroidota bacterium]
MIVALTSATGLYFIRQYIVAQAESRIHDVLQEAEALHYYVQRKMHPTMYTLKKEGRMPEEFYSPQILSSSYIAREVFDQYNKIRQQNGQPMVEYRMASKNPRNHINQADSLETVLIDLFNKDTTLKKYSEIVSVHGEKFLYYARPFLRVDDNCLACHGNMENAPGNLRDYYNWDSGFNLKTGEIPAVEILRTPLNAEKNTITLISIIVVLISLMFITLILLISETRARNREINRQKREIEDHLIRLKETQNRLIQSEKMASLGVLTAGVAHEINNPLNFINGAYLGFEKFFTNELPARKNEVSIYLNSLKTGIDRASEVVKGLNHFSRQSQKFNEDCKLHTIIDNCLLMLRNKVSDRIEIVKVYCEGEPVVKGNEGKLHQVFLNILTNAVQAISGRGRISIRTERQNKAITVIIEDNGCGIAPEEINRIIEPFYTTKEPGQGVGLGLSISYSIVKEHRGEMEFTSQPDQGTTVMITLPEK